MSTLIRFVWDNFAGTTSSLTATSTAGSLVAANVQSDEKAAVWRSTGVGAQVLDFQWTSDKSVDSVCGAWTNLSSGATVKIQGYTTIAGVKVFDQTVSPDTSFSSLSNVTFQNWLSAAYTVRQVKITITDAGNTDGYVQVSRIVIGKRISPVINARQGALVGLVERSKPTRARSGDLRKETIGRFRRAQIDLGILEAASRDLMIAMVAQGLGAGVWVSMFPEDATASTIQYHAFWGALVSDTDFVYNQFSAWGAQMTFEEMA